MRSIFLFKLCKNCAKLVRKMFINTFFIFCFFAYTHNLNRIQNLVNNFCDIIFYNGKNCVHNCIHFLNKKVFYKPKNI